MKKITIELPDDVAQRPNPGGEALEALAIDGYRSGAPTHYEASQLLHLSRFDNARRAFDHALRELDRTNIQMIDRGALTAQNGRARSEHPRPRKGLRPRPRSIASPRSIVLFQPGADAGTRKGIPHARDVRPVRRLPTQSRTAT